MLKRIFICLLLCVFCVSVMVVPAFAAEYNLNYQDKGNIYWTYGDTTYTLCAYWGIGAKSVPLYVTSVSDTIGILIDKDDVSSGYTPSLSLRSGSVGKASYTMTEMSGGGKNYYIFIFDPTSSYYGLQISSLTAFRDCLDSESVCYYLADVQNDYWSDAVNIFEADFTVPDDDTSSDDTNSDDNGFWSNIWNWLVNFWDTLWTGIISIFIPDTDELANTFDGLFEDTSELIGVQYDGLDDIFSGEKTLDDVNADYNIPGVGTMNVPFLDTKFLLDGIAHFRPYIRAFIIFLLVLFNVRQALSFIRQDAGILAGKQGGSSEIPGQQSFF